jgi:hypothetical protein
MTVNEFLDFAKSQGVTLRLEKGEIMLTHTRGLESLGIAMHIDNELEKALIEHLSAK